MTSWKRDTFIYFFICLLIHVFQAFALWNIPTDEDLWSRRSDSAGTGRSQSKKIGLWCCIADSLTRLCVYLQLNQDLIWSSKITLLTPHASAASGQQVLTRDGAVDGITRPG